MRVKIPLPNSFYKTLGLNVSVQELINLYRISSAQSGKDEFYLLGTSGYELFSDTGGNAPVWGMKKFNNLVYVCVGNNIYTINSAGVSTLKGSIGSVFTHVQFETNGTSIVVLKDTGDAWDVTTGAPVQITDPNYIPASSISQSFGYYILPILNSNEWQISDQDALTFSGFVAQAEANPDNIVRAFQNAGETWLFGEDTTEIWQFTGDINFPYIRVNVLERGCAAKNSVCREDSYLFWLGNDGKIYASMGYQYQEISTEVIEQIIAELPIVSDAIFFTYTDGGQKMLTCQFPSANLTLECNFTKKDAIEWHKRTSGFNNDRWRANCFENFSGYNLIGDYQNGKIYRIKFDIPTEDGVNVNRRFVTPYFFDLDNPISFDKIELDIEAGLGNVSGAGSDPQVFLSWTDDYGHTESNQYLASIGKQGNYKCKASWLGKGTASKRALIFTINDPIKIRISAIYGEIQKLQA